MTVPTILPRLLPACLCGETDAARLRRDGLAVLECRACGIARQDVRMTEEGYAAFYRDRYHGGVYRHGISHDLVIAGSRLRHYGARLVGPVLDVGCGNGAFVEACREVGIEADGQDLAQAARFAVYGRPLDEIDGPARFRTLTLHDVLEHAVDPAAMLGAARRLLLEGGRVIVDFPDFFGPDGAHHWKPIEHLWLLGCGQLVGLVERSGFRIETVERPIPSKLVCFASRA